MDIDFDQNRLFVYGAKCGKGRTVLIRHALWLTAWSLELTALLTAQRHRKPLCFQRSDGLTGQKG